MMTSGNAGAMEATARPVLKRGASLTTPEMWAESSDVGAPIKYSVSEDAASGPIDVVVGTLAIQTDTMTVTANPATTNPQRHCPTAAAGALDTLERTRTTNS